MPYAKHLLTSLYQYVNTYKEIAAKSQTWTRCPTLLTTQPRRRLNGGNIYRPPPNTNAVCQTFINEFIPIREHLQRDSREVTIAGDFNIDLLKINDNVVFWDYFKSILSQSFFPNITLPTRVSDRSCTLIGNCLCKPSNGFSQSTAGILISRISEHLPLNKY